MSEAKVYVEVRDEDGKILRRLSFPAADLKVDTRRRVHGAEDFVDSIFKAVREAAVIVLKRRPKKVEEPVGPRWVREHDSRIWHFESDVLWTMLCGAVIPGTPVASSEKPSSAEGGLCERCERGLGTTCGGADQKGDRDERARNVLLSHQ